MYPKKIKNAFHGVLNVGMTIASHKKRKAGKSSKEVLR